MAKTQASTTEQKYRAPIVAIMGHVDHGKTSILDYIRKTNIQSREHGGITQHIGAYQILHNEAPITFIDTPGHAAFSQMRIRGGKVADIVVLVVAADDGVQPQTREAIKLALASKVDLIVAINKVDIPGVDVKKIRQELAEAEILTEDWGGDILCVELSAKTGEGVPDLLDAIATVAEMKELKMHADSELEAIIIEAKLDKKKGVTVSCIVKSGRLAMGDEISASGFNAKVKSLMDHKGNLVKYVEPSAPVEILGFKEVPNVGDVIIGKNSDLAELAVDMDRIEIIGKDTKKTINLVLKADTQGTLEAIKGTLASLVTENAAADFSIRFMRTLTGEITDSDVLLASNTGGYVIGFNVKFSASVEDLARDLGVIIKTYKTIYDLLDEVNEILEGTATKDEAKILGRAEVLKIFRLPSGDLVAGSRVIAGALKPDRTVHIYDKNPTDLTKEDQPIYIGKIKKLKQGKDDTSVVGKNVECGVLLKPAFEDIKEGMWIEVR